MCYLALFMELLTFVQWNWRHNCVNIISVPCLDRLQGSFRSRPERFPFGPWPQHLRRSQRWTDRSRLDVRIRRRNRWLRLLLRPHQTRTGWSKRLHHRSAKTSGKNSSVTKTKTKVCRLFCAIFTSDQSWKAYFKFLNLALIFYQSQTTFWFCQQTVFSLFFSFQKTFKPFKLFKVR